MLQAAVQAGAPDNIIGWIDNPSIELTQHLMGHEGIAMILATGGPGMVKAAYSSGKPALGVGAGNTPAIIDETADIKTAVSSVLMSKTFDNGMICASEQSIVVHKDVYDEVKKSWNTGVPIFSARRRRKKLHRRLSSTANSILPLWDSPLIKLPNWPGLRFRRQQRFWSVKFPKSERQNRFLMKAVAGFGHV